MTNPLKTTKLVLATTVLLGLGVCGAGASPACVYQDAALRGGPGDSFYLIGTIPASARVVLLQRRERWSLVSYDGETGYVATAHLSQRSGAPPDPPAYVPSPAPSQALICEVDPLFGDASLGGRFGPHRNYGGGSYFSGYRRNSWTDRTPGAANVKPLSSAGCESPQADPQH